ncbi:MAG: hypothetical protein ACAI43_05240, partial [Phycisphaerae bacterium]
MASRVTRLLLWIAIVYPAACTKPTAPPGGDRGGVVSRPAPPVAEFDLRVSAREDFFAHVNNRYFAAHPIPADQTSWGVDFEITERNQTYLKAICDELTADTVVSGVGQQIRDLYATAMDEGKLRRDGMEPLKPTLKAIDGVTTAGSAGPVLARLHASGAWSVFGMYVTADQKDATKYAVYISQGATALPERDYYLADDEDSKRIRTAYAGHLGRMFALCGEAPADAAKSAAAVLAFETELAKVEWPPAKLQDPEPQYNKMTRAELVKHAPGIPWDAYFGAVGRPDVAHVIVQQPDYLKRAAEVFAGATEFDRRAYLRWTAIHHAAPKLHDALVNETFDFFQKTLNGAPQIRPRWKRAIDAIDDLMGEGLGRLYVERHFPPAAKERVGRMVDDIVSAFGERIRTRDWMTPATRETALTKLAAVRRKLGYPDKWRDYSKLTVARDSFLANADRASKFEFDRRLARLDQPVDLAEWETSPPTVNAYY